MRKLSLFISVIFLASVFTLAHADAAAAKNGAPCSKAGTTFKMAGIRLICKQSGKKLIWKKNPLTVNKIAPSASPSSSSLSDSPMKTTPISLSALVGMARSAISDSENAIPTVDTSDLIRINEINRNNLPNFLFADASRKFSFFGPTPLVETDSDRLHALSQVKADGHGVYQSQSAIPPWGVGFEISIKDPQGRFVVATSASENSGTYSWRLAYKFGNSAWKYQSISGSSHKNNNQKFFDAVTLGKPGDYSIRLEFEAMTTFYGLGLADSASSVSPLLKNPAVRVLVIGDSWVWPAFNESGPVHVWDAYPGALSWLSGWNVISAGVRGQGYLAVAANETYKDRIVRDVIPQHPAVVIFTGSSNDHLFTDQQIAQEMVRDIQALQKANPDIVIIVCSPYENGGDGKAPGQNAAMKAEAQRVGVPYIDFINLPLFDQGNNGQHQLSSGHPTRLGSRYIAAVLLKEIAALRN